LGASSIFWYSGLELEKSSRRLVQYSLSDKYTPYTFTMRLEGSPPAQPLIEYKPQTTAIDTATIFFFMDCTPIFLKAIRQRR
jgi:hypothetical protein